MDQPHALYLLMLAIGEYDVLTMESTSHVQHEQYYYPDKLETAEVTYRFSREMMDWFEEELGSTILGKRSIVTYLFKIFIRGYGKHHFYHFHGHLSAR